ncbi:MAG TPA: 4'-phosphopantetheinyl transferase superfamily protein [Burkholderiaceae bacterium]
MQAAPPVDLWLLPCAAPAARSLLAEAGGVLDAQEQARAARMHFTADRDRCALARLVLRTVLARYAPIAARDWRFETNAYGKPALAPGQAPHLCFNLSHAREAILLAVGAGCELGVDIEATSRAAPLDVADHYFAASEAQALRALPPSLQHDRFFDLWTLKESYIKARGMGLSLPLASFAFSFARDGGLEFSCDAGAARDAADRPIRFWQYALGQQYRAALCVTGCATAPSLVWHTASDSGWQAGEPPDLRLLRSTIGANTNFVK